MYDLHILYVKEFIYLQYFIPHLPITYSFEFQTLKLGNNLFNLNDECLMPTKTKWNITKLNRILLQETLKVLEPVSCLIRSPPR